MYYEYKEINFCIFSLNESRACSLWVLMDPTLMSTLWTPMLFFVNLVFLTVYIKVGYLAYKAKREIRSQQVNSARGQGNQNTSASKSTRSLLLVIGVFLSTYTIWLIVYYFTVDKYTDTVELIQTLIEWFWQVSKIRETVHHGEQQLL